jgi:hypothetical protein
MALRHIAMSLSFSRPLSYRQVPPVSSFLCPPAFRLIEKKGRSSMVACILGSSLLSQSAMSISERAAVRVSL